MTIGNALAFIKRGQEDGPLRKRLNAATRSKELQEILTQEKIPFSADDFEEACRHQLTLCQDEEAADRLKEFKLWWDLLVHTIEPGGCQGACSGCAG